MPRSLCVGVGCTQIVTRVEAGVADLRAEVADLLQAVLDLRSALGIEFECLVVGLDSLCHGILVNELRLLPGLHLAVHDVDREPRIDPSLHLGAVHRLGAGRLCVADSKLEHRGVHADEEALRRFGGSLVEGLAAVDPRCGLGAFLCVGDVRVAFLDLRQQCVFVHFLSLGSRDCQDQCGERRHKSLFHKKLNFRFAITLLKVIPRRKDSPARHPPRSANHPQDRRQHPPRLPARPSPKRWRPLHGG